MLRHRLAPKLAELNPELPPAALDAAIEELVLDRSALDPTRANRGVHELLRDGVKVTVTDERGDRTTETVRVIDWTTPANNDFLAVSQFWVVGPLHTRRCDIVCFVNGIPLVLLELKASHKTVEQAYEKNLRDYRDTIPQLFTPNALGDPLERLGDEGRRDVRPVGALRRVEADRRRVRARRRLAGDGDPRRSASRRACSTWSRTSSPTSSARAAWSRCSPRTTRYWASTRRCERCGTRATRDGRLGVFWHTQGSGKSLSMLFFTQKVLRREPGNWTFVMVTDRAELDDQLYDEFKDAGVVEGHLQATSSANLRQLLGEDHRYVFTLIHKFRPEEGEEMPVCSDREDVIVITDEAHRSQYSTLALNMRRALPNAGFLGFTGTPLIKGEAERTREVFGDYVSTYNFRDSIEDGATVPLFYENRIPELQIINESFDEELTGILEQAELDDSQERALARRFATEYQLITRPERLRRIAADLVRHFVGRGFLGKAMFVAIDKATAVRMYDLVAEEWQIHLGELRERAERLPELERAGLEEQIAFMEETDMAVVVSQSQNEIADMREAGPRHRPAPQADARGGPRRALQGSGRSVPARLRLRDVDDGLRRAVLLDDLPRSPDAEPHADADDRAREPRLPREGERPDRRLRRRLPPPRGGARDLRGGQGRRGGGRDHPRQGGAGRRARGRARRADRVRERWDVDLDALARAEGFEFIALRDASVEALLVDDVTRRAYLERSDRVRRLFAAILPDPAATAHVRVVGVARNLAETIRSLDPAPDLSHVSGAVQELLDRSVGAEEYVIRAAADGADADSLIDLNAIDFDALAARFAGRKRSSAQRLAGQLTGRVEAAARRNPTRLDLVERLRKLIDEYNAGSLNMDEMLRRLQSLSRELSEEEQRTVREGLSEPELAVFDLLTKPDPVLSDEQRDEVKAVARKLMAHIQERLVLDWRRKAETREAARGLVKDILDELPDAYDPEVWERKAEIVFNHIFASFYDDGGSVYEAPEPAVLAAGRRRRRGCATATRGASTSRP